MVEEGAAAAAPDMAESSRRAGGEGSRRSEEIPVGEPIVPPYNGSKAFPFARLLHEDRQQVLFQELTRSRVIAFCWRLGHPLPLLSTIMASSLRMTRS